MYVLVQNDRVVDLFKSREGAQCVKTTSQIIVYTEKKNVKVGDRASKLRR